MTAHGEPGFIDQVPRRLAFERDHPDVVIKWIGPYWRAVIRHHNGETVVTRFELRALLDRLEELHPPASE